MPSPARVPEPVFRQLRVFAVDPGMTAHFETAVVNETTVRIRWEELEPGPRGQYVEVVDTDADGNALHEPPLDLDRADLLAENGLAPSDGNPHFRQQMVYAVGMKTIGNFERALGRPVQWCPVQQDGQPAGYRARLRLYPHRNRRESRSRAEGIAFEYFESHPESALPGTAVFTSLSQDAIAHEVTHAILAGMRLEFGDEGSDEEALHDAFADIVALLQHFDEGEVLRTQMAALRGDLSRRSVLAAVALQIGQAKGQPDGVRNALGTTDEDGVWHPRRPDATAYRKATTPRQRGDVLVRAVFETFRKIYESRVADLRRIASKGSGLIGEGELHPDLVDRLSREATDAARHVLRMCIRGLDYLPPVAATFGDFLRAVVTADHDLVPEDDRRYRVALIDAFRSYGILVPEVGTLSPDTLRWVRPPEGKVPPQIPDFVRGLSERYTYWNIPRERQARWEHLERWKAELADCLRGSPEAGGGALASVDLSQPFEVRTLDVRERAGPAGTVSLQWVIKIAQPTPAGWSGCTLIVDAESGEVRYLVEKPPPGTETDLLKRPVAETARSPALRSLRVFAFDPSLAVQLDTVGINEVALRVRWEDFPAAAGNGSARRMLEGPVGEYLEVIDRDPASGCFYAPVDLNEPHIVAQDGLTPSEADPRFHQQMVYAVVMRVIEDFERALGRLVLWSPRDAHGPGDFVRRLRIYPHALREANAYYSPAKKSLLFGYFPAPRSGGGRDLTIFTCLSHDIVAHEVTHALLDGIHRRFDEPSNPDVLAFHEAFADIVALLEHFALPEALRHQIVQTRGDLARQNRLGELAQQFGQAIGRRGALRSAIGRTDPATGVWEPIVPDPEAYHRVEEPHDRGAILVAAVFDAFLAIYKARVADLLRIATDGSGVLPEGQLHPDLVNRLSDEAARSARVTLDMCIRALDYTPPVDMTFGDYLRALITADYEHDPVDDDHRRVAFVDAFRRYGIVPEDIRTLSVDGVRWRAAADEQIDVTLEGVQVLGDCIDSWNLTADREALYRVTNRLQAALHASLEQSPPPFEQLGLDPRLKTFEVHALRPSMGTDWSGKPRFQWVIELTQRRKERIDETGETFWFRGGGTLIADAGTGRVRYSIRRPLSDEARLARQRSFLRGGASDSLAVNYFGRGGGNADEPFAMLHRFG